jgi:hypothetical protein
MEGKEAMELAHRSKMVACDGGLLGLDGDPMLHPWLDHASCKHVRVNEDAKLSIGSSSLSDTRRDISFSPLSHPQLVLQYRSVAT